MTKPSPTHDVHIIGGGLAGSEAAWQLAQRGVRVRLSEMRGSGEMTPAHQTDGLAELVCSNSFRSDDDTKNAVGLLHHEMRALSQRVYCVKRVCGHAKTVTALHVMHQRKASLG